MTSLAFLACKMWHVNGVEKYKLNVVLEAERNWTTWGLKVKEKVKQTHYRPWQALRVPGSQILRQSAHECGKVVSPTHRPPLPPENIPGSHFCKKLNRPQGHSAAWKIMLMKKCSDAIWNRTHDVTVCSAVPQPLRHRVPLSDKGILILREVKGKTGKYGRCSLRWEEMAVNRNCRGVH
jgi:hypothetical protein